MADVVPQILERIEAIERRLNLEPANGLTAASLAGNNATDKPVAEVLPNPSVLSSTSEPGAPVDSVTLETGTTGGGKSKK